MINKEIARANILTKKRLFKKAGIGDPDAIRTVESVEKRLEQQAIRIKKKKELVNTGRVVFI